MEMIIWVDSNAFTATWVSKKDTKEIVPCLITSVGHVTNEGDDFLTIAHSVSEDCIGGVITIPKCAIKERFELEGRVPEERIQSALAAMAEVDSCGEACLQQDLFEPDTKS